MAQRAKYLLTVLVRGVIIGAAKRLAPGERMSFMRSPRRPRAPALASGSSSGVAGSSSSRLRRARRAEVSTLASSRARSSPDLPCGGGVRSAPAHRSGRACLEYAVCSPPAVPVNSTAQPGAQPPPKRFAVSVPIPTFNPNAACPASHNDFSPTVHQTSGKLIALTLEFRPFTGPPGARANLACTEFLSGAACHSLPVVNGKYV
jgi:hypothetical protein